MTATERAEKESLALDLAAAMQRRSEAIGRDALVLASLMLIVLDEDAARKFIASS